VNLPAGSGWLLRFEDAPVAAWETGAAGGRLLLDLRDLGAGQGWLVLAGRPAGADGAELRCTFGFCDSPAQCDALRAQGFRVLECAVHETTDGRLDVRLDDGSSALSLEGLAAPAPAVPLPGKAVAGAEPLYPSRLVYHQELQAPDLGRPDSELNVRETEVGQTVQLSPVAVPMLTLAGGAPALRADQAWRAVWSADSEVQPLGQRQRVARAPRWPLPPAYRFSDVEAIGFRLDLAEWGVAPAQLQALVDELVQPLNFHRGVGARGEPQDFEFRAASSTLVLELLRYGRMESDPPGPGLAQCQHELLLRVLVGRVDDASGQARDPAFFVPAIFVDNPWSRVLGRELQGFDKRLVAFSSAAGPVLRADGCLPGSAVRRPLEEVASVRPIDRVGAVPGAPLFELTDVPPVAALDFVDVDDAIVLAGFDVAGFGWRQADFDDIEFRRAFAREAMGRRLAGFRSVQVSPVDSRDLPPTWIGADCAFERLRVCQPRAQPRLRLLESPAASLAWNRIAALSGGRWLALPTGDWYRLRFDMSLKVDDGLGW
jgi:hypothetical protein